MKKKKKNNILNILKKFTKDELFLEVKKSSPGITEEDFKKIIKTMKTLDYFDTDEYFKGDPKVFTLYDAKLINDIYEQAKEENTNNYQMIAAKIFKESNLRKTIEDRQGRPDSNKESEETANTKVEKALSGYDNFITKLLKNDKAFKWIKRVLFFSVVIFVGGYTYINIQSTEAPGIKKAYEESTSIKVKDLSSFTIAYKYNIGSETHAVFTYLKEDGFYAGDINLKTKQIKSEGKINNTNLTAENPIIYSQLFSYLSREEKGIKLKEFEILNDDEIKVNGKEYKLKIDGTKLSSVNEKEIPFQNVIMTQHGQQDMLNKYDVQISKLDQLNVIFTENKELLIEFTIEDVKPYYLIRTNQQEKVYFDIINKSGEL